MRKILATWGSLLMATLFIVSCYKDKGSYDIIDYNDVNIVRIVGNASVFLGDTLRLKPQIAWENETNDTLNFSYEWKIGQKLISSERDLTYLPEAVEQVWAYFYITDNRTGLKYKKDVQLTIRSPFNTGWLVLAEKEGQSSLSFLRREGGVDDERKLFQDIYQELFPTDPLGSQPKRLVTTIFPNSNNDEVLVIQGNQKSVFLDGRSLKKVSYLAEEFNKGQFPDGQDVLDYFFYKTHAFAAMNDGRIFWKSYRSNTDVIHTGEFFTVPLQYEGESEVFNFIEAKAYSTRFLPFFDMKNSRLLHVYSGNSVSLFNGRKLPILLQTGVPGDFISPDNMNGYEYIYGAEHSGSSSFMNILRNKSTGGYILQDYGILGLTSAVMISNAKQDAFAAQPYLDDQTIFYKMRRSAYLFFATGSILYFYDFNTRLTKVYHDFGGSRIVDVRSGGDESELAVAMEDGRLYVCSPKNTILAETNPGASGGILASFEGIGKIVQVAFKWGKDTNHYLDKYE